MDYESADEATCSLLTSISVPAQLYLANWFYSR